MTCPVVRAFPARRRTVPGSLWRLCLALVALAGCTGSDGATSTADAASATVSGIGDLDGLEQELEVEQRGEQPWRSLLVPPPVGARQDLQATRIQEGLAIEAELVAEVVSSAADGSSHTVTIELLSVSAGDRNTTRSLVRAIGARLTVTRDDSWSVTEESFEMADGLARSDVEVIRQLLTAPVVHLGPAPSFGVGTGAVWTSTLVGEGGSVERRHEVTSFDGFLYRVERTGDGTTAVLEGRTGEAIPSGTELTSDAVSIVVVAAG